MNTDSTWGFQVTFSAHAGDNTAVLASSIASALGPLLGDVEVHLLGMDSRPFHEVVDDMQSHNPFPYNPTIAFSDLSALTDPNT